MTGLRKSRTAFRAGMRARSAARRRRVRMNNDDPRLVEC